MLDVRLARLLDERGVRFCVIGAVAMAAHGWARYTADLDLLTMDGRVLDAAFWSGIAVPEIEVGEPQDPLAGLVRWTAEPAHDLLVGRGYAMQLAVDSAQPHARLGCRVATPLATVLLKLEAGGPQDLLDILTFVEARRALDGAPFLEEAASHVAQLDADARATWSCLERNLGLD